MVRFSDTKGRLKRSWNGKDVYALAADVGEKGRYRSMYGPMSDSGHGQATGIFSYIVPSASGAFVIDMKPSTESVDLALTAAMSIAVELCDGVAGVLDVNTPTIAGHAQRARTEITTAIQELEAHRAKAPRSSP